MSYLDELFRWLDIDPPRAAASQQDPPPVDHKHQCRECQTIWQHPDTCRGSDPDHHCPRCGAEEFGRYYGHAPAELVFHSTGVYVTPDPSPKGFRSCFPLPKNASEWITSASS